MVAVGVAMSSEREGTGRAQHCKRLLRWALISFFAAAMLAALTLYGISVYSVRAAFTHRVVKLMYTPEQLGLRAEDIDLSSSDGITLKGWWIPVEQARGAVLLLHGMDGLDASCLLPQAKFLNDAHWSVFLLDMRAHGRSGGQRIGLSIEEPRDVAAALNWLDAQSMVKGKPLVLLGLSMGGATAIRTAASRPDVDAVISVSSFASFEPMMGKGLELWLGRLAILTLYRVWPPAVQPIGAISHIAPRPVLLMHGTADKQIPVRDAYLLKQAGGPSAELWIADGADHLIFTGDGNGTSPGDVGYRQQILDFLKRVKHVS